MSRAVTAASIVAQTTFTDAIALEGKFNLSISGTWVATVTVQRSFDKGVAWLDVETHTENVEKQGEEIEDGVLYRVGCKTGEFTSGTVVARISQ
jgi:hypothetical protein